MHQPVFSHILKKTIYCFMAQYRPMMAGHPLTQQRKEEEKEDFYTTSLHLAALEGDTKAVAELLKAGQFVEAPDHDLKTPLHLAAACEAPVERSTLLLVFADGHVNTVELLLKAHANVSAQDDQGETPLMAAVANNQFATADILLKWDQDLDAVDDKGHTALHLAAKGGSVSLIMILNEFGSDVEAKDMFGRTPLHHAVAHRHEGATKSLLQCGANRISAAHNQETAIHVAVAEGQPGLLACLIMGVPAGTLEQLRNAQGNNPLHTMAMVSVVSEQHTLEMAELLLASGMHIDQPGMLGWTCLHAAVRRKQRALAGLLLKKGADPNLEAQDGLSVMAFVLQNQRRQGYNSLLELFGNDWEHQ